MTYRWYTTEERDLLRCGLTVRTREEMEDMDRRNDVDEDEFDDLAALAEGARAWAPTKKIRASTPGRDGVPFFSEDLVLDPGMAPRSYPDWGPGETHVVSGPLGDAPGQGRRFPTRAAAKTWAREKFGRIVEQYLLRGRYALRVPSLKAGA